MSDDMCSKNNEINNNDTTIMRRASHGRYWPEIDGLRALAVISVIIFHVNPKILPGGFIGVDVFFAISGYLITLSLIDDNRAAAEKVARFYQRRIARIAPASMFVTAVSLIIGAFIYSAQDYASLGASAIAATWSVINIKLLLSGNYFAIAPDSQALMHYWSLSVEEQFYLIYPILIVFSNNRKVIVLLFILMLVSFVACVIATHYSSSVAFFLLPYRAWELIAGAIIAICKKEDILSFQKKYARIIMPIGLFLIIISLFITNEAKFPGWIAAVPVIGTSLVLSCLGSARGLWSVMLANRATKYIGKRSYSLYLWHWPIFSFIDYKFYLNSMTWVVGLKLLLTICCAFLAYALIERPAREWLNRTKNFLIAIGGFALVASGLTIVGYYIWKTYYINTNVSRISAGGVEINHKGSGNVVLMGDSQATQYGRMISSIAVKQNFRLNIVGVTARNELPGEVDTLWPNVYRFISDKRPDVIIVAYAWSWKIKSSGASILERAIPVLLENAKDVIIIEQPPGLPHSITRHSILSGKTRPPFFEAEAVQVERKKANEVLKKYEGDRVKVLSVEDLFLNKNGQIEAIGGDGKFLYHDGGHLSDSGVFLVRSRLEQLLADIFKKVKHR